MIKNKIWSLDGDARSGREVNSVVVTELTSQLWEFHIHLRRLENRSQPCELWRPVTWKGNIWHVFIKYPKVIVEKSDFEGDQVETSLIFGWFYMDRATQLMWYICWTGDRPRVCRTALHLHCFTSHSYISLCTWAIQGEFRVIILVHLGWVCLVELADVKMVQV